MPREKRHFEPGSTYHVVQTAVAEAAVLSEAEAREYYIARLDRIADDEGVIVLAYALMDTHVHLVVWVPRSLSTFMRRIGTSFAQYYNRKHDRRGRVFGEVYWCKAMTSELHMRMTIRYVLLNPAKAGLCRTLRDLESSGRTNYAALQGRRGPLDRDVLDTLAYFGPTEATARQCLREWLLQGNQGFDPDKFQGVDEGFDREQARGSAAMTSALEEQRKLEARVAAGWTVERIVARVCARMDCSVADLRGHRKGVISRARAAICYLARVELGLTHVEIATALRVSTAAVLQALERGEAVVECLGLSLDNASSDSDTPGRGLTFTFIGQEKLRRPWESES